MLTSTLVSDPSEPLTCAACGCPIPQPRPLLCTCGASLSPASQAVVASSRTAAQRASRLPPRAWLFSWCASIPFQVVAYLAVLLPSARDYLLNIHDGPFLLLLLTAPAAFAQPLFLAAWFLQGTAHALASPARRLAVVLAFICTVAVIGVPLVLYP